MTEEKTGLELMKDIHQRWVVVAYLVVYKDSSLIDTLRHRFSAIKERGGDLNYWPHTSRYALKGVVKFPLCMEEPTFLAVPTHRTKCTHKISYTCTSDVKGIIR